MNRATLTIVALAAVATLTACNPLQPIEVSTINDAPIVNDAPAPVDIPEAPVGNDVVDAPDDCTVNDEPGTPCNTPATLPAVPNVCPNDGCSPNDG